LLLMRPDRQGRRGGQEATAGPDPVAVVDSGRARKEGDGDTNK